MLPIILVCLTAADTVAPDLSWVRARMAELRVPGLAVAVVVDGKVAWTRAFGVANRLTRDPAQESTVWPVASLGKPVTAYAALRLVQAGRLELDAPLVQHRPAPAFLPRDSSRDAITLRHLLTHTSGLSNYLRDRTRRLRFTPGERYQYSGVGFMYLQQVLEQTTGQSFDSAMAGLVFDPLEMPSAWFGRPRIGGAAATVHAALAQVLPPGGIMLGISAIGAWILLIPVCAITRRRWRFGLWHEIMAVLVAAPVAWWLLARLGGSVMALYFTAIAALAYLGPLLVAAAVFAALRRASLALRLAAVGLVVAIGAGALFAGRAQPVPLPTWYSAEGNAAASLRSSIGDLARFAAELVDPALLDSTTTGLLRSRAVRADSGLWWGLGIAVSGPESEPRLIHRGSNPGVAALLVAVPSQRAAVVVVANAGHAAPLVQEVAERVLQYFRPASR
ncbi:MAG TPA: serine hydrolase domain-containing protein [Gemmatimonadales bacterium]